ncbi:MAG: TetR family transcriptional regulator [Pseudonocardiales bacterium]|nr:MAG: TetR family transcriptional regulator [Pseudonocardiales bacterium]
MPTRAPNVPSQGRAVGDERPYHHGRLRAELLVHAHGVLRADGADALTLRDLGRRAGVSPSAPFRHFATRTDLLDALAMDGYRTLLASMRTALESETSTQGRLHALARNYVAFARTNPPLLRLMTGRRKSTWDRGALGDIAGSAFALLESVIRDGQAAGELRAGDPSDLTIAAWSQVHGLATLIADGMLEPVPDRHTPSTVVHTAVDVLINGLRPATDPG